MRRLLGLGAMVVVGLLVGFVIRLIWPRPLERAISGERRIG